MALKFGTSGVRGLVGEMTDRECYLYAAGFGADLQEQTSTRAVALAGDLRASTPRILNAVGQALADQGFELDFCGFIPTSALANYALTHEWAGIMVTGSHIPDDRNGIKFYLPWGETLKADEARIAAHYRGLRESGWHDADFTPDGALRQPADIASQAASAHAAATYRNRYLDFFPPRSLSGLRLVVYEHSAVIRDLLPELLQSLGATVTRVARSEHFVPVDTEAVENAAELAAWVREHDADALVSTDGDSDRPLLVDEQGRLVRGDVLGILAADYLHAQAVVAPVSCNSALEACGRFPCVRRTRIGSPYVIAGMQELQASEAGAEAGSTVVGYEANGGFLTATVLRHPDAGAELPPLPTRDAVLPLVAVLAAARSTGQPVSRLVAGLPPRFTASGLIRPFPQALGTIIVDRIRRDGLPLAERVFGAAFGKVEQMDFTDGARLTFAGAGVVHLRPSGNAPEFRCYTEAGSPDAAEDANAVAREVVTATLKPMAETWETTRSGDALEHNLAAMAHPVAGMDILIVSTTSASQAAYWQRRLERTRGQVARQDASVLAVHEDWPGGAGNGLGSLYALRCADARLRRETGKGLFERLQAGAAAGLYHTAGKGTRLAPLPGSENNNKPGVKLPGLLTIEEDKHPITILESAIRQTAIYAASRRGRVSVFWGDQVFIPGAPAEYEARWHVDILARLGAMPDAAAWEAQGLHRYGLIAVDAGGGAAQVEKISHAQATGLVDAGVISTDGGIGVSLGSFSISAALAQALIREFTPELERGTGKLDSDPHFWMPLSLDETTYMDILARKGSEPEEIKQHYARMRRFRDTFLAAHPRPLFGAVDIGTGSYWWDYGQLPCYLANNLTLTRDSAEAAAMRRFFRLSHRRLDCRLGSTADVDDVSCLLNCRIGAGRIRRSVLIGVSAARVDIEDSVVVGTVAPEIIARDALLYHVMLGQRVLAERHAVKAGVFLGPDDRLLVSTSSERDGGCDWFEVLPGNPCSYAEIHERNQTIAPDEAAQWIAQCYRKSAATLDAEAPATGTSPWLRHYGSGPEPCTKTSS